MNFRYALKLIFVVLIQIGLAKSVVGQNKKVAEEAFETGNYFLAIDQYERLIKTQPEESVYHLNLGLSYLRTNVDPKKALEHLLKVQELGKTQNFLNIELARAYMFHLAYDDAKRHLEEFEKLGGVNRKNKDDFDRMVANCNAALDLIKYPVDVSFKNLGINVNSEYPDYHPFITKDGKTILYTTRRKIRPGSKPEFDGYFPSDIFKTEYKEGEWTEGKKLGDRINTIYDEQTVGITQSGDTMFFYIDHVEEYGDIYTSTRKGSIYSNPKKMENEVNSEYIESACSISRDGNTILFSSNRPGGYGGLDIWMIRKNEEGNWGEAKNLGPEINSPFNEDFPTLSIDESTMYYSSDGHPGMGGYDLYFSTWDEQSSVWTKPQNLGYPINGPSDDKTISFAGDGSKAVMTGLHEDRIGDLDIYTLKYNKEIDTDPAVFLFNIPTNETSPAAKIEIRNDFDELIGEYLPNRITGRYLIALPKGKYFIYVDSPGFEPYNEVLVVSDFHKRQMHNVRLIKLQK